VKVNETVDGRKADGASVGNEDKKERNLRT
jgi:hypothetical protein